MERPLINVRESGRVQEVVIQSHICSRRPHLALEILAVETILRKEHNMAIDPALVSGTSRFQEALQYIMRRWAEQVQVGPLELALNQ